VRVEAQTGKQTQPHAEAQVETLTDERTVTPAEEQVAVEAAVETPARARAEARTTEIHSDRPFRVKLRGSVLVLIRLPNKRQLRAALHQLSITGGVINLEKPLDEKIEVELIFHIDGATIRGKAQMLFPMWATQGWMQPFRFVGLSDADSSALQESLQSFIGDMAKSASAAC
jgi:hypothetical protein